MFSKKLLSLIYFLLSLLLLGMGIGLFIVREQKIPKIIRDYDLAPAVSISHQNIVSGQYLILLDKNLAMHLDKILEPLDLELLLPLLDWALVGKKNHFPKVLALNSSQADEDQQTLNSLLKNPYVLDAHHNFVLETAALPQNPSFSHDWHLQPRSGEPVSLNMPLAWEKTQGSPTIRVAIIDDFFYKNSFSFAERFKDCLGRIQLITPFKEEAQQRNQVPHGEYMLLALGACNNQSRFSPGMDSQAQLLAISRASRGHAQTIASMLYAASINVCSESLLACPASIILTPPTLRADIILLPFANNAPDLLQFFSTMLEAVNKQKVIVVSAAGNNNENASNFFPGQVPGLINVGSINEYGQRSLFSNWGTAIDFLAPGEAIQFIYPTLRKNMNGTSLSAAFTAGSIALMKSLLPTLSLKSAHYFLSKTATPLTCQAYCLSEKLSEEKLECANLCCNDPALCGAKAIDVGKALEAAQSTIAAGLLELNRSYLVFTRNNDEKQEIEIKNVGDEDALVEARTYDDTITVFPKNFSLTKKGSVGDSQVVTIGFEKEPYKRETSSIEFVTKNANFNDKAKLFIEYIPKKSVGAKKVD